MPLFTIVILTYNRADLIEETLATVYAQRLTDYELIIVDDGSTDGTPELLKKHQDKAVLIRQENQGIGGARNTGLERARGDYIIFLDSDDLWFPWTLETLAKVIHETGRPSLVMGAVESFHHVTELKSISEEALQYVKYEDYLASYRRQLWLTPSITAVRTEQIKKIGGFMRHRFAHEENHAWIQISAAPGFVKIDSPQCCARREHATNISGFSPRSVEGSLFLLEEEGKGTYPGGRQRRKARRALVSMHVRPVSIACAQNGAAKTGWKFYRHCFWWHVSLGKLRYLGAFPVIALMSGLRRRKKIT